jgi:hypothetical protein
MKMTGFWNIVYYAVNGELAEGGCQYFTGRVGVTKKLLCNRTCNDNSIRGVQCRTTVAVNELEGKDIEKIGVYCQKSIQRNFLCLIS